MHHINIQRLGLLLILITLAGCQTTRSSQSSSGLQTIDTIYEVRAFGAKGDGSTLDTPAINNAIAAAASAGGGTVHFSAGTYLCYSIHLKSNITLYLDAGATIQAAGTIENGEYDPPEPFDGPQYQDFGHCHWHNSLIWGEDIQNVAIEGPGLISGKGALNRGSLKLKVPTTQKQEPWQTGPEPSADTAEPWEVEVAPDDIRPGPTTEPANPDQPRRWRWAISKVSSDVPGADIAAMTAATRPIEQVGVDPNSSSHYPDEREALAPGIGNKAIALKNAHNVILRDFSILEAGHFALLATAVDGLTVDNVKIDTNRDGMDIDCCRNVHVTDCSVNSPQDDAIVLKSSYGLQYTRDTENVTITGCFVTGGYVNGTLLDGTFRKLGYALINGRRAGHTGRIKFGTESNGGFKNIAITNCLFDDCQGLAIESVDGGVIDNVVVSNIAMRDVASMPIFIRLAARMRGPAGAPVGAIRHVLISDVMSQSKAARYACMISGIPGHEIEDVHIRNVRLIYPGGAAGSWTHRIPPEEVAMYPEPTRFGGMPAYGFFIRHVNGLELGDIDMTYLQPDARPPFILTDVQHIYLDHVTAPHDPGTPMFVLQSVEDFTTHQVRGIFDVHLDSVEKEQF